MIKKKQYLQEIKKLNIQEIQNEIIKQKKELVLLKIKCKTKQKIKTHLIKQLKNKIAQLITLEYSYNNSN